MIRLWNHNTHRIDRPHELALESVSNSGKSVSRSGEFILLLVPILAINHAVVGGIKCTINHPFPFTGINPSSLSLPSDVERKTEYYRKIWRTIYFCRQIILYTYIYICTYICSHMCHKSYMSPCTDNMGNSSYELLASRVASMLAIRLWPIWFSTCWMILHTSHHFRLY